MVDHLFCLPALPLLSVQPLRPDVAGLVLVDSAPSGDIDLDDATIIRHQAVAVADVSSVVG